MDTTAARESGQEQAAPAAPAAAGESGPAAAATEPGAAPDGHADAHGDPAARPLRPWEMRVLGRVVPRAGWLERFFWAVMLACCAGALSLAAFYLEPDTRGIGTHEQLGLPPCGFVEMLGGVPCPSCGYTTTFTLAAHGRPFDAFQNQPFGFLVFLASALAVPLTALAVLRGVSLFGLTDRWPWGRIGLTTLLLWLAAWAYKCVLLLA